jgi:hypothetical protein
MADRLEQALARGGVDHRCEFYDEARHACTMTDFPVCNRAAAARREQELIALVLLHCHR